MKRMFAIVWVFAVVAFLAAPAAKAGAEPITKLDQDFTIYVYTQAGGALDVRARAIAPFLSRELGVTVAVENVVGGGGIIGTTQFVTQPRGKYDMAMTTASIFSCNPLFTEVAYSLDDFAPVHMIDFESFGLFSCPSRTGIASFDDLRKYGEKEVIIYGSGGSGTIPHLAQNYMYTTLGMESDTLPHNGAPEGLANCMGGHNIVTMAGLETARSYVEAGSVLPILTFDAEPYTGFKGYTVPSVTSLGHGNDFLCTSKIFLAMHANVDPAVLAFVIDRTSSFMQREDAREALRKVGAKNLADLAGTDITVMVEEEIELMKRWVGR